MAHSVQYALLPIHCDKLKICFTFINVIIIDYSNVVTILLVFWPCGFCTLLNLLVLYRWTWIASLLSYCYFAICCVRLEEVRLPTHYLVVTSAAELSVVYVWVEFTVFCKIMFILQN